MPNTTVFGIRLNLYRFRDRIGAFRYQQRILIAEFVFSICSIVIARLRSASDRIDVDIERISFKGHTATIRDFVEQGVVTKQLVQHECRVHLAIFHSPDITSFGTVSPDGIQCRGVVRIRAEFREVARIKGRVGTIVSGIICGSRRRPSLEAGAHSVRFPEGYRIGVACQFKRFRLRCIRRQISIRGIVRINKRQVVGHINRGKRLELDSPRQGSHYVHEGAVFHDDGFMVTIYILFVGNGILTVKGVTFGRYSHDANLKANRCPPSFIIVTMNRRNQHILFIVAINKGMLDYHLLRVVLCYRGHIQHLFKEDSTFAFNRQGLLYGRESIANSLVFIRNKNVLEFNIFVVCSRRHVGKFFSNAFIFVCFRVNNLPIHTTALCILRYVEQRSLDGFWSHI